MFSLQGRKGNDWDFELTPVFFVALMNFTLPELNDKLLTHAGICDLASHKPISNKVGFSYIQLPCFDRNKPEECVTAFDQWIYILKNMEIMERMPFVRTSELFKRLDKVASYAALSDRERKIYDAELMAYRDMTNQLRFAEKKGLAEGRAEGEKKGVTAVALNMLRMNMDVDVVARASGLSREEVISLKESL